MLPEDIDDLFREKLAGHQTPPADDLWARLQHDPAAALDAPAPLPAERLDQVFQQGLRGHATPPGRALWERLEDEHLRPRQRRSAAWWPMALAAAVALLLVAGGARLWLAFPAGNTPSGTVASGQTPNSHQTQNKKIATADKFDSRVTDKSAPVAANDAAVAKNAQASKAAKAGNDRAFATTPVSSPTAKKGLEEGIEATIRKNRAAQATRSGALASNAPKANRAAAGHSPRQLMGANRQPDAATGHPSLTARSTPRQAPTLPLPTAADEQRPTAETTPALAIATSLAPTPEIVRPEPVPAAILASTSELITVEVRNGGSPAAQRAKIIGAALAESEAPAERRGLGGRLLQQAGHLARGERVSLAEVTGLPENMTLRATVGGRSVSKSIRL